MDRLYLSENMASAYRGSPFFQVCFWRCAAWRSGAPGRRGTAGRAAARAPLTAAASWRSPRCSPAWSTAPTRGWKGPQQRPTSRRPPTCCKYSAPTQCRCIQPQHYAHLIKFFLWKVVLHFLQNNSDFNRKLSLGSAKKENKNKLSDQTKSKVLTLWRVDWLDCILLFDTHFNLKTRRHWTVYNLFIYTASLTSCNILN